jgi:medium-chain acyl-[acyl-carrier-protein] hydrolase
MMSGAHSWIVHSKPNPQATLRLFCFPYAGGSASLYRSWASNLMPQVDVCPVQMPGRETRMREAPFTRLEPLIQALATALRHSMDLPFAFFGHSMGGLISFELARHLRSAYGLQPAWLFISGHSAPQLSSTKSPIHQLPDPELLDALRQLNGTPKELLQHTELMQLVLPLLRADFAVCETYDYAPGESLACPISVFGGLEDHNVSREDLAAWREHTRGSFSLRMFPGDHFFLNSARLSILAAISEDFQQMLGQASK